MQQQQQIHHHYHHHCCMYSAVSHCIQLCIRTRTVSYSCIQLCMLYICCIPLYLTVTVISHYAQKQKRDMAKNTLLQGLPGRGYGVSVN